LDRIVAVVNGKIITLSDLQKEREIRTALGENPGTDEMLRQALIEELLVEEQIGQFATIDVTDAEIEQQLRAIRVPRDITAEDMRQAVERQIRRLRFFDQRFRQFIAISEEEVQQYYDTVFVPEARLRGLARVPALDEVTATIRENIANEKLGREVELWLETIRRRSEIEVFQ
jgi:parvulin-like peptidyl-prolyl isomerase